MKPFLVLLALIVTFVAVKVYAAQKNQSEANPLLRAWVGPYGGVPPFDQVKVADFQPALETAMKETREEINKIATNPEPATFENTILALEESGARFDRVQAIYNTWNSSMQSPEFQAVENTMEPVLSKFDDEIVQNAALFQRIQSVDQSPAKAKSNPEQQRLVWKYQNRFVLNGAMLNSEQKKQVLDINQRLATLYTEFSQNELADEENEYLLIEKPEDLEGLSPAMIESASAEAERHGQKGKWAIANTRSSMEPFLTTSPKRDLREKAFKIWSSRGDNANAHNNNQVVTEILSLRAELSRLMVFETYAHWRLSNTMAKDPQKAMDLMLQVWKPAVARVKQEVADMQVIVDSEKENFKIQPWDYRFYAEKVRKAKYDLDLNSVTPYLQLKNIQQAMFWMAQKLYGFHFTEISGIPVFNPSMSVYKVTNAQEKFIGLWYFDPYARPGKKSGAWMDAYREQYRENGKKITTLVSNNANFIAAKAGAPVLLSWDDAVTMFHEFGHALHGLNSNVTYRSLSGTNTAHDFVEFPSQFHEHYLETPEVLRLLKDEKGNSIPPELLKKIDRAKTFNQGFATVEFLASAIVDMKLHLSKEKSIDPKKFEAETLKEIGMPEEIIMRHRIPHFGHVFAGEGYAAGYYGYLWAQVLENDAFEAFTEKSGPYDQAMAKLFHDHIMAVGNTIDPGETYRLFRGRDATIDALLRQRGFPVPQK